MQSKWLITLSISWLISLALQSNLSVRRSIHQLVSQSIQQFSPSPREKQLCTHSKRSTFFQDKRKHPTGELKDMAKNVEAVAVDVVAVAAAATPAAAAVTVTVKTITPKRQEGLSEDVQRDDPPDNGCSWRQSTVPLCHTGLDADLPHCFAGKYKHCLYVMQGQACNDCQIHTRSTSKQSAWRMCDVTWDSMADRLLSLGPNGKAVDQSIS